WTPASRSRAPGTSTTTSSASSTMPCREPTPAPRTPSTPRRPGTSGSPPFSARQGSYRRSSRIGRRICSASPTAQLPRSLRRGMPRAASRPETSREA
ncbi:MAG: hypothetical protein AVDCRST_MAG78-3017, partial [uncultured Rubrobacteraceae bacterium]